MNIDFYPEFLCTAPIQSKHGDFNESDAKKNIGLVGETGSGKTSFIKAIMRNNNMEIAETGVASRRTSRPNCYDHPENPNIKLWDLPSLGTAAYPDTKTYFEKLKLAERYHAFLLFSKARFTINSQRLAIRLESTMKPFLFVRSFIDVDANSERATKPKTFDEDRMNEEIRQTILNGLTDHLESFSSNQIFLISNVETQKWDFNRLNDEILFELTTAGYICLSPPIGYNAKVKLASLSLKEKREKMNTDSETSLDLIKRYMPERTSDITKEGITKAQKLINKELDEWNNTKINLAIIGDSGVGKSSFINAIRGITDFDEPCAAKTGTTETTMTPEEFHYPDNPNITLWDCPGIGTASFPDIETYCSKINFGNYDAFIIMTATRFSEQAGVLAKRLQSINKPFFFARTKIDQSYVSEKITKKSTFNQVTMLEDIKEDCSRNLKFKKVELDDNDIFLISSLYLYQWDFARLTLAINNRLHSRKRECFLLSMLSLSEDILERKVEFLKDRVWAVAFFQSMIWKPFSRKKKSRKRDFQLIVAKVEYYRCQLGFPKEDSEEFRMLSPMLQTKVRKFYLTSEINVESWLSQFNDKYVVDTNCSDEASECGDEEHESSEEESLSWLDVREAIKTPYKFVFRSLQYILEEMKVIAVKILNETAARSQPDVHVD